MMILDILVPAGDGQDRIFVYLYFIQLEYETESAARTDSATV